MKYTITLIAFFITLLLTGCGGENKPTPGDTGAPASELSQFELENGIGPVKDKIELTAIKKDLAEKGRVIFETKCSSCHKLDEKYVGPAQRNVIARRSPEYIMNMIMNPDEMLKKHPEAKKMLAQYLTPMTNQNINFDDARALLEYFRQVNDEKK